VEIIALIVANRDMSGRTALNLTQEKIDTAIIKSVTTITVRDRENYDSQDVVFAATSKNESFTEDIWICDSESFGNNCNSSEGIFSVEEIKENIMIDNSKTMMATSLKV
jgi:hypothetical protein